MDFDGINDMSGMNGGLMFPAAALAWQVFMNTGEPGMYMLYKGISDEEDKRFE